MLNTFRYGTLQLDILNQSNDFVPKIAEETIISGSDKKAIALGIKQDLPILLIGEAGTGKTSIARFLAHKRQQGYTRISMTGFTTPDELIGSKAIKDGATYYEDGILTKAMKEGHLVVLDEINATTPDCLFIIHGLLDEDKRLTLPNGEIVRPHKDFRFIATMNADYEGTKGLNRALLDRFSIIIAINTLMPKQEEALLTKRTKIDNKVIKQLIGLAWTIRKAYKEGKILTYASTRTLLQMANLIASGITLKNAFILSLMNKARVEEQKVLMEYYNAILKQTADNTEDEVMVLMKSEIEASNKLYEDKIKDCQQIIDLRNNENSRLIKANRELTIENKKLKTAK